MNTRRWLWNLPGFACVAIGIVNMFIPGLPTTVFLVIGLWCFKKGSPRFENWLLNHRLFGATLRDWERTKSIKRRTKNRASIAMLVMVGLSLLLVRTKPVAVFFIVGSIGFALWYIWSRPDATDLPMVGEEPGEQFEGPLVDRAETPPLVAVDVDLPQDGSALATHQHHNL